MTNKAIGVVGFLITFFFAVPLALRLNEWAGAPVVLIAAVMFSALAAWAGHTPETAAFAEDVCEAMKMAGITHKAAAIEMEVPEPVLSAWLSGKEQGSFRIAKLGAKFMAALGSRLVARHSDAAVVERQELCDLVNAVQVLTAELRRPQRAFAEVA